jgi:hypothetical protein
MDHTPQGQQSFWVMNAGGNPPAQAAPQQPYVLQGSATSPSQPPGAYYFAPQQQQPSYTIIQQPVASDGGSGGAIYATYPSHPQQQQQQQQGQQQVFWIPAPQNNQQQPSNLQQQQLQQQQQQSLQQLQSLQPMYAPHSQRFATTARPPIPQQQPPMQQQAHNGQQPQYYVIGPGGYLQSVGSQPPLPQQHTPPGSMQSQLSGNAAGGIINVMPVAGQQTLPPPYPGASSAVYTAVVGNGPPSLVQLAPASAGQIFASSIHSSLATHQGSHVRSSMGAMSMGSMKHSMGSPNGNNSLRGRGSTGNVTSGASAVGAKPMSHAAEQPVPGVIHSVRPFLGPKGIGSILDTPSKLPLLDTLPPLARKRPQPVRIPLRDAMVA